MSAPTEAERQIMADPTMQSILLDMELHRRERLAARAKENPAAYRLSTLMAEGASASWRYYTAGKDGRGREVRFAYSVHRNAAGYFLLWREVASKRQIKRDLFGSAKTKADAMETCRRRRDAWRAGRAPL